MSDGLRAKPEAPSLLSAPCPVCGLAGAKSIPHACGVTNSSPIRQGLPEFGDRLAALETRERELDAFLDCEEQASKWMREKGTQSLVDELRAARTERRRIRLGTPNTLILLAHIDRLEAEIAKGPIHV